MKQYKIIPSFEQCLKICENNKNFSHSVQTINEKEIHSFKYNLSIPEMWEENDALDRRLNMRGIAFINKEIVALPFPKFFNLEETKFGKNIDITDFNFANEKIDGSLISVFKDSGKYYCKTMKSLESDVSKEAQKFFDLNLEIKLHAMYKIENGFSPMYEYVSPTSKIVIDYKEPQMFYLGCRNIKTGEIIYPNNEDGVLIKTPIIFKEFNEIEEFLKRKNVEGVVVVLKSGQMVKVKTEEYCKLHRIVSNFSDKAIIESICEEKFDDLLSQLKQNNMKDFIARAEKINQDFWLEYKKIDEYVNKQYEEIKNFSSRKEIAMHMQYSSKIIPWSRSMIFNLLDKKSIKELIIKHIKNSHL